MRYIGTLEMHVTHACNLTCESCCHYSNQGHKGMLSLEEGYRWMTAWARRVIPYHFCLMGGEPTLHPQLEDFLLLARVCWPGIQLRLITNGFFLHRHPNLPFLLRATGSILILSKHHDSPEYRAKYDPIHAQVRDWEQSLGLRVEYWPSDQQWTEFNQGFGAAMRPYEDGNPRQSWEHCLARNAAQLFEGKIWKCPPLAYLKLQDAKYHLSEKWQPYLRYQPLAPDCSEDELNAFFTREDVPECGMCPAAPKSGIGLPSPLIPLGQVIARHKRAEREAAGEQVGVG